MKDKSLILLRGLPGAGKTTLASLLVKNRMLSCFSLDSYFTNEKGEYQFDYKRNHLAYKACQSNVEEAMQMEESIILVDQTFALLWEMQPYLDLAKKYEYQLFVCTVENRHNGKNQHGISDEQVLKMAKGFSVEILPEDLREG
ncbi:ATP-binding protein [Leptospira ognonensis]|uniref:ATP-binding protein n=1 Tax=Leptospira ognonensis TaxID=2484945 RepID=A0A4R9K2G0_9LEPT|nr:AAA family ATPase [Leptospira ognonensis]TGL60193.1 ATP-binding protein [Leptospira ognonensis]